MNTNLSDRNIEWALKTFRPLLRKIAFRQPKDKEVCIFTSEFKVFNRFNMSNCQIRVRAIDFTNPDDRGLFIWQYFAEEDFYILYIILNKSLYADNSLETVFKRKSTGIHEFTHCVAAMNTFSHLKTQIIIESLQKRMNEKFHCLNKIGLENMFVQLNKIFDNDIQDPFPDEHFRIIGDGFNDDYSMLVKNFLLSFNLFCENDFFNTSKQKQYKDFVKVGDKESAFKILKETITEISAQKDLPILFILQRIKEELGKKILAMCSK